MKKKTYIATIITVAVCAAGFVVTKSNKTASEKTLDANVEALTSGENGNTKVCYNSITSKDGSMARYCPTCSYVPGTDTWYSISSTCAK